MVRTLFPALAVVDEVLPAPLADAILAHAIASEAEFRPSTVSESSPRVDRAARISLICRTGLGPLKGELRAVLQERFGEFCALAGMAPFATSATEIELAAHRDGHFYRTHIDTSVDPSGGFAKSPRMLSCVLYFNRLPQRFTGGEIRFRPIVGEGDKVLAPAHNRMVAFASFVPHEVLPTHVPGDAFGDARFSVNCWFHRDWA